MKSCENSPKRKKTKREIIEIGTIREFVAAFASLCPLEASKTKKNSNSWLSCYRINKQLRRYLRSAPSARSFKKTKTQNHRCRNNKRLRCYFPFAPSAGSLKKKHNRFDYLVHILISASNLEITSLLREGGRVRSSSTLDLNISNSCKNLTRFLTFLKTLTFRFIDL